MPPWASYALSAIGAILSMGAVLGTTVIAWLAKYILKNIEHRVTQLEAESKLHDQKISVAETKTAAEEKTLESLRSEIGSVRDVLTAVQRELAELTTLMKTLKR